MTVIGIVSAQYLPPAFTLFPLTSCPPQTIISLPVHTAVSRFWPGGALKVLIDVQEFEPGSYRPPFRPENPAHTIISCPFHMAVWPPRGSGALLKLVAVQLLLTGSYLP